MGPRNHLKERLAAGDLSLCLRSTVVVSAELGPLTQAAGFDAFYIDLEHTAITPERAADACLATLQLPVTALVRVAEATPATCVPLLDAGCQGIVAPHVDDAEQAHAVVDACRFPPRGTRSVTGALAPLGYADLPAYEAARQLDESALVIVMIESAAAVEQAEAIAAVEGVDVLFVGSVDLGSALDVPGDPAHPRMRAAYERVGAACAGRAAFGVGGVADPAVIAGCVQLGARFVSAGSDASFLLDGARRRARVLREAAA